MRTFQLNGQAIPLELHLDVVLLCVGLVVGYIGLIRKYGPLLEPTGKPVVTRRQATWFGLGVFSLWLASGSPLHTLADQYLFSAHMIQHLVQALALAPLFVMGTPGWMLEVLTRPRWLRASIRTLAAPLIAGLAFNVVLLGIHWPMIVELMVRSEGFHAVMHITLVLSSLLMWLPVLSTSDLVARRLTPLPRMGYLFGMTLLPTVPASFLTFAPMDSPLYPVYGEFPRIWEYMTVGQDMLVAGLLMKSGAGFLLWGIIATMFFRWSADEERREKLRPERPAVTTG